MTEQEIYEIALSKYPISDYCIGGIATGKLYDKNADNRAVFIEGFKEAINYTHCCKSDSELLCDKNEYGQIKKLYIRVGNEWIEQKKTIVQLFTTLNV